MEQRELFLLSVQAIRADTAGNETIVLTMNMHF